MRHVLLTNDDGFDAPGLAALYRCLDGFARVSVVAPASPASSAGHGVTDRGTIQVDRRRSEPFGDIYVVKGTPADCVRLGVMELLDSRPDWVLAGINRGGNMGVDVYYSGTVAAAREAAFLGLPAIAVSQYIRRDVPLDWDRAAAWVRPVIARLIADETAHRPPIWSVNLPALPTGQEPKGVAVTPMALEPLKIVYRRAEASSTDGGMVFEYVGEYSKRPAPSGTDVGMTFGGHITLTPLSLDLTFRGTTGG